MSVKGKRVLKKKKDKRTRNTTKHSELINIGKKWLKNQGGKFWSCGVVFTEIVTVNTEIPDIIGFSSSGSVVIEVKSSRTDFLRDKNKMFRKHPYMGMGGYRFYLCPTDIIKEKDLPEKWGLVYVNENGKARIIVKPEYQERNIKAEFTYMYSIIRRLYNAKNTKDIQTFFRRYS